MVVVSKVLPIHQLIKQTQRRKDDYEWEGDFEKAMLEGEYLKELKDDEAKGITWYPNFQITQFLYCLQWLTSWPSSTWYTFMQQSEIDDAQDKNAPFDDVTHWVGNIPDKDNDSTKRTLKRYSWWQTQSNILRKKLGMETKRKK